MNITIDNKPITAQEGETILQAAHRNGITAPGTSEAGCKAGWSAG